MNTFMLDDDELDNYYQWIFYMLDLCFAHDLCKNIVHKRDFKFLIQDATDEINRIKDKANIRMNNIIELCLNGYYDNEI